MTFAYLLLFMKQILIATHNPAKFKDLSNALKDSHHIFISFNDLKINDKFEEVGITFEENAIAKAKFYADISKLPTIADDGGLEIEKLDKEPGVKTRRWIDNKESTDDQLIKYTLIRMKKYQGKERKAQLRAVICLALPGGAVFHVEGKIAGVIAEKPYKYNPGFPFDGLLYFPDKKKYYYQLKYEDKIPINHRTIAIKHLKPVLEKVL